MDSLRSRATLRPPRRDSLAPASSVHPASGVLAHLGERGPFDLVGDLHGCLDELLDLMALLGYQATRSGSAWTVSAPAGRRLVFLGDLVNRGPATPELLRLVMHLAGAGQALCVAGNQDLRLLALLRPPRAPHPPGPAGLALKQINQEPQSFRRAVIAFLASLPTHLVLDEGRLIVAHAGLPEAFHGSPSAEASHLAVEGHLTGERDEFGHLVRFDWTAGYTGQALVVYGHTPVPAPLWTGNALNLDTGCVYGGHLSALRYPERQILSVPARALYSLTRRRFPPNPRLAAAR